MPYYLRNEPRKQAHQAGGRETQGGNFGIQKQAQNNNMKGGREFICVSKAQNQN